MQLFVFGDIHRDFKTLKYLVSQKAGLFICHGDLSDLGEGLEEAGEILAPLKERLWLLPGNNETCEQIQVLCQKHGFVDFHQKLIKKKNYFFAGFGYSTATPFGTPGEVRESEFAKALKKFSRQKNLVLICHSPPKDSQLDVLPSGVHVGSQAIRNFIEKEKPLYFFCGHLHENAGKKQRLGETTCFSVGKQGQRLVLK